MVNKEMVFIYYKWFSSVCYVTVSADSGFSMLTVSLISLRSFTIVDEENRDNVGLCLTTRQKY